jgi:hypothetical protein
MTCSAALAALALLLRAAPVIDVPLPPPPKGALPPSLRPSPKAAPARGSRSLRVAVPDVKAQGELPPRQLALFEGALLAELRKLEGVSVVGMSEIREMLSFEYQRQMMGCASDESCLAEIGGALGVDEILNVSVIVVDGRASLAVKRVDMRSARVAGSDSRRLTRANGEELLSAVGPAIQTLFPDRPLRAGKTRGVDKEMALRLNPPPLPRWAFFSTAGAAVAATAAGATYAYLARDARSQYAALANRSTTESVSGPELKHLEGKVSDRTRTANVFLFTGAGLAVAAGVEAFFTDWHGYRAAVQVTPGGAGVGVGGKF